MKINDLLGETEEPFPVEAELTFHIPVEKAYLLTNLAQVILMDKEETYKWNGDWQGPGHGSYVIFDHNYSELEPGDVCQLLNAYHDLLRQIEKVTVLNSG